MRALRGLAGPRSAVRRGLSTAARGEAHDVVVVGGGLMGVWTAIQAARRGASVLLVEQFRPDHSQGSSHGDGRIFRLAYAEDVYFDMMKHSLPLWRELQASAREPVIATTGQVNIAPEGNGRLEALEDLYRRRGVAYERLSADALKSRFPQYGLQGGFEAIYQPDGGALFASSSIRAAWKLAEALGVDTITDFRAASLDEGASGVSVVSQQGTAVRGKCAVVAPGAWLSKLALQWFNLQITTRVTAEEVCYFAPRGDCRVDHSYRSMPVFSANADNGLGSYGYYGLPMIDVPGIKVSAHYCGPVVDPDARPASAGGPGAAAATEAEAAARERVAGVVASSSSFVRATFPHVEPEPFSTSSCLYTATPDHNYVIGRVPGSQRVVLAGGGSGHAFKMGPAIGDCCAALALGQPAPLPLGDFCVGREALRREYREESAGRR